MVRVRQGWRALKREQSSPARIGVAVGLGVFLGCSPAYFFQTLLAVVLAQFFKLNKLAVLAGVQISAPPITPLVVIASVKLGDWMLSRPSTHLTMKAVNETSPVELLTKFSTSLAVGGMTLGVSLGAAIGGLAAWLLKRKRQKDFEQPPLTEEEVDTLHDALKKLPRRFRHYGSWKVRLDPLYAMALPLLAYRKSLVDLGAGIGLFGLLARARFAALKVHCVEWDPEKAGQARLLLAGLPDVTVEQGDGRKVELEGPDAITLFDVLHYSPVEEQREWLKRCATALAPGGLLVVRDLDPERGRWGLAEKIEKRAVNKGWNRGAGVYAWPISGLAQALRDLGLQVEVKPCGSGVFSANALVIARKA